MFLSRSKKKAEKKETAEERLRRQRAYIEAQQRQHTVQQALYSQTQQARLNRPTGTGQFSQATNPTAPQRPSAATPSATQSRSQEDVDLERAMRISLESHAEEERLRKEREETLLQRQLSMIRRREKPIPNTTSTFSSMSSVSEAVEYDEPAGLDILSPSERSYATVALPSESAQAPASQGQPEVVLRRKKPQSHVTPRTQAESLIDEDEDGDGEESGLDDWADAKIRCKYVGTFDVDKGVPDKEGIKQGIIVMKEYLFGARPAFLLICLEGLKVIDSVSNQVAITHSISNVIMSTIIRKDALFGFVGRDKENDRQVCHVFVMESPKMAEHTHAWVSKAFKIAFCHLRQKQNIERESAGTPSRQKRQSRVWAKYNVTQGIHTSEESSHPRAARNASSPTPSPRSANAAVGPMEMIGEEMGEDVPEEVIRSHRTTLTPKYIGENTEAIDLLMDDMDEFHVEDDDYLKSAPWFQAGIPREIAEEMLLMGEEGAFLVRDSMSNPGNFALTLKSQDRMHNFFIQHSDEGYRILIGAGIVEPTFPDLGELILHYAEDRGHLPVELSLDSMNAVAQEDENPYDDYSSFIDPEYERVHAF